MAASAVIAGAPESPRAPPMTTTTPEVNLVDADPRRGSSASTAGRMRPTAGSPGAPGGIPISITLTRPAWSLPGAIHRPGLAWWKVAVTCARTAAPATSPVEASTPLGTSAATTVAPAAVMSAMTDATGSRGAPVEPVPSSASTIPPAPARRSAA